MFNNSHVVPLLLSLSFLPVVFAARYAVPCFPSCYPPNSSATLSYAMFVFLVFPGPYDVCILWPAPSIEVFHGTNPMH